MGPTHYFKLSHGLVHFRKIQVKLGQGSLAKAPTLF